MKNYLIIPVLLLGACVFMFSTCKKKEDKQFCSNNPNECKSVLEAKDYFAFKVGSWWVYEEENSGLRDSCYVTHGNVSDSWYFETEIYSTLQDFSYNYYPKYIQVLEGCNANATVNKKCLYVDREKGKPGEYVGHGYCFFVNYYQGASKNVPNISFSNNKIIIDEIYSNYTNGTFPNQFQKTIKIHELNTYIEGEQPTNHYYSKGIGIVKKEFLDSNQVWNLVNYHIE